MLDVDTSLYRDVPALDVYIPLRGSIPAVHVALALRDDRAQQAGDQAERDVCRQLVQEPLSAERDVWQCRQHVQRARIPLVQFGRTSVTVMPLSFNDMIVTKQQQQLRRCRGFRLIY